MLSIENLAEDCEWRANGDLNLVAIAYAERHMMRTSIHLSHQHPFAAVGIWLRWPKAGGLHGPT
jgi:hypothetical protein